MITCYSAASVSSGRTLDGTEEASKEQVTVRHRAVLAVFAEVQGFVQFTHWQGLSALPGVPCQT